MSELVEASIGRNEGHEYSAEELESEVHERFPGWRNVEHKFGPCSVPRDTFRQTLYAQWLKAPQAIVSALALVQEYMRRSCLGELQWLRWEQARLWATDGARIRVGLSDSPLRGKYGMTTTDLERLLEPSVWMQPKLDVSQAVRRAVFEAARNDQKPCGVVVHPEVARESFRQLTVAARVVETYGKTAKRKGLDPYRALEELANLGLPIVGVEATLHALTIVWDSEGITRIVEGEYGF